MLQHYEYAGFWRRAGAAFIDSMISLAIFTPIDFLIYPKGYYLDPGQEPIWWFEISCQLACVAIIIFFWLKFAGTPGKRLLKLKVLDEVTGNKMTMGQAIIRYIGYIPSSLVLGLGFFWIIWDKKKQGWHDKMAKSVVVKEL